MPADLHALLHRLAARAAEADTLLPDRPWADGGTEMLLPRLVRAGTNQIEGGPAAISRYGIWANTAHDHVAAALDHLDAGRVDEARALLVRVGNALTVFAALQAAIAEREG